MCVAKNRVRQTILTKNNLISTIVGMEISVRVNVMSLHAVCELGQFVFLIELESVGAVVGVEQGVCGAGSFMLPRAMAMLKKKIRKNKSSINGYMKWAVQAEKTSIS